MQSETKPAVYTKTSTNTNYKAVKKGVYERYIKRSMDFILALLALVVLSPLLLVIAILVRVMLGSPIIFKQERPGLHQKIFVVYKFRTMVQDAATYQKVGVEVTGNDTRIPPLGKFLRRFKLDELIQLINILKGDMAIVGPRPTLFDYISQYEEWELKRFYVKPGLTGFAQVNGNIYLQRREKSLYDVKYIENINFISDMKIILKTILIVIFGEDKFINKVENDTSERNLYV